MKKKRLKPKKKIIRKKKVDEIKIDQILLYNRQIFLNGPIFEELANRIIQQLIALDALSSDPIALWINSPGGCVYDGFAIIDVMRGLKAPVITIVNGKACSMAGIISISGHQRWMSEHSVWMAHDMATGAADYMTKIGYRFRQSEKLQTELFTFLRSKTKLTEKDLEQARHGELWLDAKTCREKGIVELIVKNN